MSSSISRLALALVLLLSALPARADARVAARPRVRCVSCLLVDDLGHVLFQRAPDRRLPNASTTKMVTALLTLAKADLDDVVRVSQRAVAPAGGFFELQPGDRYSVEDLLSALLLPSSNDAAVALAEHVSGSEGAFVAEMNAYVARLGLRDTRFVTSHGLDRTGHYSTAHDLARIADEVLGHPVLARIVAMERDVIEASGVPRRVDSRNRLLGSYRGAIGVKTGHTARAGYVLVAAARRHGRRLVAVAMGSPDAFADSQRLLDYGFAELHNSVLVGLDSVQGEMVFDGFGAATIVAGDEIRSIVHPDKVHLVFEARRDPVLPLAARERVGRLHVFDGSRRLGSVDALIGERVPDYEPSLGTRFVAGLIGLFGKLLGDVGRP